MMTAMSQAVHSEKASPGKLGLSNIIVVTIPEAWTILVLMVCYDTKLKLKHRFQPEHYKTCVTKAYKHMLKLPRVGI